MNELVGQLDADEAEAITYRGKSYDNSSIDDIARENVERGISIYDQDFERGIEMFGSPFLRSYIGYAADTIGDSEVDAFAYHDEKKYVETGHSFGRANELLFDVSTDAAYDAGAYDSLALLFHDVVDEGVSIVRRHMQDSSLRDLLPPAYEQVFSKPQPRHRYSTLDSFLEEIVRNDAAWDDVRDAFRWKADELNLPSAYADEMTAFYRDHSVLNEKERVWERIGGRVAAVGASFSPFDNNLGTDDTDDLVEDMVEHIYRSQQHFFTGILGKNLLHRAQVNGRPFLEYAQKNYLKAVKSHDAHNPVEQAANRDRRKELYWHTLKTKAFDLYSDIIPNPNILENPFKTETRSTPG